METLNKEAYTVEPDHLIYDRYRLIDSWTIPVTVSGVKAGVLKRGQVVDFNAETGIYEPHKSGGAAKCIVARNTAYTEGETEVAALVYISGDFRTSACVSDVELTAGDIEHLRDGGIVLK